jgi:DNA-binding NarL/FixJ family response regulator
MREGHHCKARVLKAEPTPRQRELIQLVANGNTERRAALDLGISFQTARNTLSELYRRIGATHNANAVYIALKHGWIE